MVVKAETECIVTLEGINKSYQQPNGQQIIIIENISLALCSGEIVALLGLSGSGKSTLMRMIACLISPTQGQGKILYPNRPLIGLNPGEWRYLNRFMGGLGSGNVFERVRLGRLAKSSNRGNSYSFKGADCSSSLVSLDSTPWSCNWSQSPSCSNLTTVSPDCGFCTRNGFVPSSVNRFNSNWRRLTNWFYSPDEAINDVVCVI